MKKFILPAILVLLNGCGTTIALTPEQRTSIESLSLERKVDKPKTAEFGGGIKRLLSAGGGAIGSLLESSTQTEDQRFTTLLNDSGIDIAQIVYEQFDARLKVHPFFGPRYRDNGAHKLRIEVSYYSYLPKNMFTNYYRPIVFINYQLISPSSEVIAKGVTSSGATNDRIPQQTLEQVHSDPQILKGAFTTAVNETINEILDSLMKK